MEHHCDQYPGSVKSIRKDQKHFAVDIKGEDAIVTHWTQENCTKAAVEMIVIDEMPFSVISDKFYYSGFVSNFDFWL